MAKYRYLIYQDESLVKELKGKTSDVIKKYMEKRGLKDISIIDLDNKGVIRGTDNLGNVEAFQFERYKG